MTERNPTDMKRCRETQVIDDFLANDYYDSPLCFFPRRLKRAAARWMAATDEVYFIVAQQSGENAGYVFAHTFGPNIWRVFTRQHPHLLLHIGYAFLRMRAAQNGVVGPHATGEAIPVASPEQVRQLGLEKIDTTFAWGPVDGKRTFVDMLFVSNRFRGHGVATALLNGLAQILARDGVGDLEAHIDGTNYASMRAFLRAGWSVAVTTSGDCKAEFQINPET